MAASASSLTARKSSGHVPLPWWLPHHRWRRQDRAAWVGRIIWAVQCSSFRSRLSRLAGACHRCHQARRHQCMLVPPQRHRSSEATSGRHCSTSSWVPYQACRRCRQVHHHPPPRRHAHRMIKPPSTLRSSRRHPSRRVLACRPIARLPRSRRRCLRSPSTGHSTAPVR